MRIIYLHQYFNTPLMTGGTRSYEMGRRLAAHGHEVHLITTRREGESQGAGWEVTEESGITVHWLTVPYSNAMSYRKRMTAFFRFAAVAAKRAASLEGDVVFATSTPLTIALPGAYASWRRKIPMVFEVRDLWPELPIAMGAIRGRLPVASARWLERFAYRHSKAIVALSPDMKAGIVRAGYPADNISVIPNSADLDMFRVAPEIGQEFRQQHEWLKDRPFVVYVGTLGRINGVEYLVRVAKAAQSMAPEVRFLVVGRGAEQEYIAQEAKALGVLGSNFHMLPPMAKQHVPAVLSAADIATSLFIPLPEMWANSANKFFDALASGTPVAINHDGWIADLLRKHDAGLVLDPHETEQAAEALINGLRNRDWLMRAGQAAQRLAEEQFSRDKLASELEHVLIKAVES